jgi:hypothetical protein
VKAVASDAATPVESDDGRNFANAATVTDNLVAFQQTKTPSEPVALRKQHAEQTCAEKLTIQLSAPRDGMECYFYAAV